MSYRINAISDDTNFNFSAVLENEYAEKVRVECSALCELSRQLTKAYNEHWRVDLIASRPVGWDGG